jgi:dUTP pyrophosphatase
MKKIGVLTLDHFDPSLPFPIYGTKGSAGADICACLKGLYNLSIDENHVEGVEKKVKDSEKKELRNYYLELPPSERVLIPTGLSLRIPEGYEIQVRPRSGLALKNGLTVLNAPGTIDSDYQGEIKILLINLGHEPVKIHHGDRIAQLVVAPAPQAQFVNLNDLAQQESSVPKNFLFGTLRGEGGFGHTGI